METVASVDLSLSDCCPGRESAKRAMEQRLYGMNSSTLHHYPQSLGAAYPALHQTFHPHRQAAFSSMYSQGFAGGFPGYPGPAQDWGFTGAAGAGLGGLGGLGGNVAVSSPCGGVLAPRDPGDYLYAQGGAASAMQHPGAARALAVSAGAQGYCDVAVYPPGSYSPQEHHQGLHHHHAFPPSPSQSLSSSPASTDSCDKARGGSGKEKGLFLSVRLLLRQGTKLSSN